MKRLLLLVLTLGALGACAAETDDLGAEAKGAAGASAPAKADSNAWMATGFDKTGVAPIANMEAAMQVDQDSPSFKAWLDNNYGARKLGDDRVGAIIQKVVGGPTHCDNNQVGAVTTSTPMAAGGARCLASMNSQGYYACSGNSTSGECNIAFGIGPANFKVQSCANSSGTVPYPGSGVPVTVAKRCNASHDKFNGGGRWTGYMHSGLRGSGAGIPSQVYEVPATFWNNRTDFQFGIGDFTYNYSNLL